MKIQRTATLTNSRRTTHLTSKRIFSVSFCNRIYLGGGPLAWLARSELTMQIRQIPTAYRCSSVWWSQRKIAQVGWVRTPATLMIFQAPGLCNRFLEQLHPHGLLEASRLHLRRVWEKISTGFNRKVSLEKTCLTLQRASVHLARGRLRRLPKWRISYLSR